MQENRLISRFQKSSQPLPVKQLKTLHSSDVCQVIRIL
jgi:hypothetical protein